ncbi:glycosyltransferase [Brachybacterium sp. YJGR34]|uniref:glycosyltransferase family protein n=1 Tax=Brachybacterium sp. YJGR34 TaxID=2059911 RepID=UPI000E0B7F59|nr:glycosyltransferase [Brachybacterium sp. YJGR34]
MTAVDLLHVRAAGLGWGPIDELATLCARLLGARLLTVDDRGEVSLPRKLAGRAPRRRARRRALLVLAPSPAHLAYAARRAHWMPGYHRTAAWVIDSFWTDRLSGMAAHRGHFDHVFITDPELIEEWSALTGAPVHWAPWGADTLAATAPTAERPTDLVRIGRQPAAWADDADTRAAAAELGLVVEGRPPLARDPAQNQAAVRRALGRSKFALAFTNRVSPAPYTHPTREYLTGRWTDALAQGATVAGVAPPSAAQILWPGATVDLDPEDLRAGLTQLQEHVAAWRPATAARHRALARERLDWRHRIAGIAEVLEAGPFPALEAELGLLAGPGA